MLTIFQSHLTEQLFDSFCTVVARRPANMPVLQTEWVLVQNPDMAQWLKMELAASRQSGGIAANIEFPLPSAFFWRLFSCLFSEQLPVDPPFSKDKMTWQLMSLLPELAEHNVHFEWVRNYLVDVDSEDKPQQQLFDEKQKKLYQLCGQISDLFDQYLMYRPDWLEQWEECNSESSEQLPSEIEIAEGQLWQVILWSQLSNIISERAQTDLHRGRLLRLSIDKLNSEQNLELSTLPKRLCIFGISSMPEQNILLLNALAKHIDIHWFQLNPCREFWLDIIDPKTKAKLAADKKFIHLDDLEEDRYFLVGNPLLASMGTLGREHLSLMYEQLEAQLIENEEECDFPTTGALGLLQNEILHLHNRGQFEALSPEQLSSNQGKLALNADDLKNIEFHINYSPMREVEVLKDQLLKLFAEDPSLKPNDVLVMMPDGGAYAPYINAVFSAKPEQDNFPYSINDLSLIQESPLLDSLLALFNLPESRFHVSELLSILEVPAVLKRFDIDLDELADIKHWLQEVGINWGRDAKHRQELGLLAFEENSWLFGIKRMLTGYAMHPEQGLLDGALPYLEIEGSSANALGKLLMFIDSINVCLPAMQEAKLAHEWSVFTAELIERFYSCNSDEQILLQKACSAIALLAEHSEYHDFNAPVSRLIVRDYLEQQLTQVQSSKRFRAGAINFSTLMPMRSIPFKVIALLGMNEGAFPRQSQTVSFDLMSNQRRRGDRSSRLDDRYLFLEALLSCRQHLHISWVGRDIRNDSELPPSILLAELMDYMSEAWMLEEDSHRVEAISAEQSAKKLLAAMSTYHPLQAFNPQYFEGREDFFSYSQMWLQGLTQLEPQQPLHSCYLPLDGDEVSEDIELSQLQAFFINPCKAFMQRRLGVYFDEQERQLSDAEPFAFSALQKWQIKDALFTLLKNKAETENYIERKLRQGDLPFGYTAKAMLEECQQDAEQVLAAVPKHLFEQQEAREYRLSFPADNFNLPAALGSTLQISTQLSVTEHAQVAHIKIGTIKAKDKIRTWLSHLFYCAALESVSTLLIDKNRVVEFPAMDAELAKALLEKYLRCYFNGLRQPLAFFINLADAYSKKESGKEELSDEELLTKWLDPWDEYASDGHDEYNKRCFAELEPQLEAFKTCYKEMYKPMFDYGMRNLTHKQYGL